MTLWIGFLLYRSWEQHLQTQVIEKRIVYLKKQIHLLKEAKNHAEDAEFMESLARCQGFVPRYEKVVIDENLLGEHPVRKTVTPCLPPRFLSTDPVPSLPPIFLNIPTSTGLELPQLPSSALPSAQLPPPATSVLRIP